MIKWIVLFGGLALSLISPTVLAETGILPAVTVCQPGLMVQLSIR